MMPDLIWIFDKMFGAYGSGIRCKAIAKTAYVPMEISRIFLDESSLIKQTRKIYFWSQIANEFF